MLTARRQASMRMKASGQTAEDLDVEDGVRLFLAAWGTAVKDPPGTLLSQDDPNRPETEGEAISAEAIGRSPVRQGVRRAPAQGPSVSPDCAPAPAARPSPASNKPETPEWRGPDPSATSLLRYP